MPSCKVKKPAEHRVELKDNKPVLYMRNDKNEEWSNVTHTNYQVELLKFVDGVFCENTYLECDFNLLGSVFEIIFNFICSAVKYDERFIWSYWVDPFQGYPSSLLFDVVQNTLNLTFKNGNTTALDMRKYFITGKGTDNCGGEFQYVRFNRTVSAVYARESNLNYLKFGENIVWARKSHEPHPVSFIFQSNSQVVIVSKNRFTTCTFQNYQWLQTITYTN
ncbi:SfiI-subtelomeric fragment related protein family member, putative [Theileria annulata]|uniref:SfiI-subtelomeric related protein family member, putative n=1 Tax=Theileria annulata TaxID=5874 RepID=Q4UEM7_THEAN|nr:SfiI-subtelomeric fragment related protein family member, putative [Theileria annulata]CAI74462.1 SfiI-subtelomeric fragment related protein family member, putative [Theileria annulata]